MSRSRKHITTQLINSYPEPLPNESIVRVISTRGTNQVEVEYPNKEKILVMMPSKFKKLIWTKKGDYLIISTDRSEGNRGKIKGIIEHILVTHQIKHLKKLGVWPSEFVEKTPQVAVVESGDSGDSCENDVDGENEENGEGNKGEIDGENGEEDGEDGDYEEESDSSHDSDDEIFENPNRNAYSDDDEDSDDDDDEDDE